MWLALRIEVEYDKSMTKRENGDGLHKWADNIVAEVWSIHDDTFQQSIAGSSYGSVRKKTKPYDYLVGHEHIIQPTENSNIRSWNFSSSSKLISLIRGKESRRSLMLSMFGGENITFLTKGVSSEKIKGMSKAQNGGSQKVDLRDNMWCLILKSRNILAIDITTYMGIPPL